MTTETPVQARSAAKVAAARVLRAALHAADLDQADLARLVGVPSQRVQKWCDKAERETMSVADLAIAPRAVAVHVLRWIAERHHAIVVDQLEAGGACGHMQHLFRVLETGSAATTAYASMLVDGQIDAVERERLIPLLRRSIQEQQAVLEMLHAEGRPRAVGGTR